MEEQTVRRKRAQSGGSQHWPKLQTSVPPYVRDRFHAVARARGISLALFLEELSEQVPELRDAAPKPPKNT